MVEEFVIRFDVVKLPGWLIVLECPVLPSIHGNCRAPVIPHDQSLWVSRVDPQGVIIPMRSGDESECLSSISRPIGTEREYVDSIDASGIGKDVSVIPRSPAKVVVPIDLCPVLPAVV